MILPIFIASILILGILAPTARGADDNASGGETQAPPPATETPPPAAAPPATETPPPAAAPPATETPPPAAAPPATETQGAANNESSADFVNNILAVHNNARAAVGVPPLVWSEKLAADAKTWVEYLASSTCFPQTCVHDTEHLGTLGEGENVANTGPPRTPPQPAEMIQRIWLAEKNDYHGGPPTTGITMPGAGVTGHYTQMVWNTTKAIGCAIATSNSTNSDILVCRYSPPGNYPRPPY
jgi:hypothetical protein